MTFAAKRRLDYLLGEPLCGLLNAWVRLFGFLLRRDHHLSPNFRRLWVLKFVGLGSLLNARPLLRALRQTYPDAELTLITFPGTRFVGDRLPQFDRVVVARDDTLGKLAWDCLRLVLRAWRERPELTVDLEVHSRFSTLVSVLTMARNRAGFFHSTAMFREGMYTHLMYFNRFQHVVDCYQQLGRALGCAATPASLATETELLRAEDYREAEGYLARLPAGDSIRLIAVNPNASPLCPERKWPAVSFSRFIDALLQLGDWRVVLVGAPAERAVNEAVLRGAVPPHRNRVHNAAGELSLGGTLALLTQARLLVTTDSGLLHFAAALGVDTVSLWGPGWPGSYAPKGDRHRAVREAVYCSPCLYMADEPPCAGDNQCMKRLPVAKVLAAAAELLGIEVSRLPSVEEPSLRTGYLPGYVARRSVPTRPAGPIGGQSR